MQTKESPDSMRRVPRYDPHTVEQKWQRIWEETDVYHVDLDAAARPFMNLMEFPYPSGEGLHVGHVFTYSGADVCGRYHRMLGDDVFQPMGFDAFGIHAENYALRMGVHPGVQIPRNIARFRDTQMTRIGVAFNWERQIDTTTPGYYRWTQWIFLQLYHAGLAYRAEAPVNWCPSCKTTLADEQVIDGVCERCGAVVTMRRLTQWFLRITRYAERLLDYSGGNYPDVTRKAQTAWIGRREGTEIRFPAPGAPVTAFTSRPDTLFGAAFLVLAPEHPDVERLTAPERRSEMLAWCAEAAARTPAERLAGGRAHSGLWTGVYATNPVNGRALPIWVAEYVLRDYGTGAIYAVPGHDARDLEFARVHDLPVLTVVEPDEHAEGRPSATAYEGEGRLVNSGPWTGMPTADARRAITTWLAQHGLGGSRVTYRLRDWLISRQRYWGPPIPIVYCDNCGIVPVPERDLPVLLPYTDAFRPLGTGGSPLASLPAFVHTRCPRCGAPARRETDVSDNFLDSAWYYLRYTSTEFDDRPWDKARLEHWMPVSRYTGGEEHATLHHMYARFLWKAMQDLGHIPAALGSEPFARLTLHGVILKNGQRMSKSRRTVVNPDEYIARYGADVLRVYLLFIGPFERGGTFQVTGVHGVERWAQQLWRLAQPGAWRPSADGGTLATEGLVLRRALHRTVRRVSDDIEAMSLNTAIAELMAFTGTLRRVRGRVSADAWRESVETLIRLAAPFAPHLAEEAWSARGLPYSVHRQPWPTAHPALADSQCVTIAVQVNGRLRARLEVPAGAPEEDVVRLAMAEAKVQSALAGRHIRRTVFVPDRVLNLVL